MTSSSAFFIEAAANTITLAGASCARAGSVVHAMVRTRANSGKPDSEKARLGMAVSPRQKAVFRGSIKSGTAVPIGAGARPARRVREPNQHSKIATQAPERKAVSGANGHGAMTWPKRHNAKPDGPIETLDWRPGGIPAKSAVDATGHLRPATGPDRRTDAARHRAAVAYGQPQRGRARGADRHPVRRRHRADALPRTRGRHRAAQCADGPAAGGGRACGV